VERRRVTSEPVHGFFFLFLFFIRFIEAGMKTASVKPRLTVTMRPRRFGLRPPRKIIFACLKKLFFVVALILL